ncbi:cytochrome P450 26A1-like [Branchiostoma floridae]|uniref:Cytochrome P450 26A1-like n=1 Tax=Branchiostoma floridae TaxID=7739 RepID=A0A9J7KZK5_BRAFL|nr:cytochrome P450 26A1-like [Branchiostoma floridae]
MVGDFPKSRPSVKTAITHIKARFLAGERGQREWDRAVHKSAFTDPDLHFRLSCCGHTMLAELLINAAVPLVLVWTLWTLWKHYSTQGDPACDLPLPKGSMGLPFIGETLAFVTQGADFSRSRHELYGDVYKTHILGRPTVRVRGADNVRKILHGENTLVTTIWPYSIRAVLGTQNLGMSFGEEHRFRKRVVMKAFNQNAMESYLRSTQTVLRETVAQWCGQPQPVVVYPASREMALKIAAASLIGVHTGQEDAQRVTVLFQNMIDNLFSLPVKIPFGGLSKALRYRQIIDEWLEGHIKRKQRDIDNGDIGTDALSRLILAARDVGHDLNSQEIQDTAVELLFAGHETTSSAATSLIMHLALQPQVVQKVQEDLEKHGLLQPDQPLSLEQVGRLTYVGQVVKEVLRISPPIGGGFRKALKTFELDGFQVPAGWTVTYSIRDTHGSVGNVSSPDQFDPDRWAADSDGSRRGRHHYIPFGAGPRACAGKEFAKLQLKLLCVELVRSCRWELADGKVPAMTAIPVPRPVNGLPVQFTPCEPITNNTLSDATEQNTNLSVCYSSNVPGPSHTSPKQQDFDAPCQIVMARKSEACGA